MITFLKDDVPALIAFTCLCVAAATTVILAMVCLVLLASGWRAGRKRDAARDRRELAELRYAVRDAIDALRRLGTSGTGQYAAHVLEEHLAGLLGDDDVEQQITDDVRADATP